MNLKVGVPVPSYFPRNQCPPLSLAPATPPPQFVAPHHQLLLASAVKKSSCARYIFASDDAPITTGIITAVAMFNGTPNIAITITTTELTKRNGWAITNPPLNIGMFLHS